MKKNILEKHKAKFIIAIIVIIIITFVVIYNMVNIENFLEQKGFVKEDEATYYKKLSKLTKEEYEKKYNKKIPAEYDYLYFGIGTYSLSEEIGVYDEDVKLEYIGEYNYKKNVVSYSIRGEYNTTAIQFSGEYSYNSKKFTCVPLLHSNIEYDNDIKKEICTLTKYHSINLYKTSMDLMDDERVLNKVIKESED